MHSGAIAPARSASGLVVFAYFILAAIPAASGSARGALVPGLKLSDLLVLGLFIVLLFAWRKGFLAFERVGVSLAAYAATAVLVTLINFLRRDSFFGSALLHELAGVTQYLLIFMIAFWVGRNSEHFLIWFRISLGFAAIAGLLALLQVADVWIVRELLASFTGNMEIADPFEWKVYRGTAFFPSWHALGMYTAIHVIFCVVLLTKTPLSNATKRYLFFGGILAALGLVLSFTATPIIIAALAVFWLPFKGRRLQILGIGSMAAVVLTLATPLRNILIERWSRQFDDGAGSWIPQTIRFRFEVWQQDFFPLIQENFWFGYGPYRNSNPELLPFPESMYIALLLDGGVILLVAFLIFIGIAIHTLSTLTQRSDPQLASGAQALRYILITLIAAQFLHPYFEDVGSAPLIFIALGLILGLAVSPDRGLPIHPTATTHLDNTKAPADPGDVQINTS